MQIPRAEPAGPSPHPASQNTGVVFPWVVPGTLHPSKRTHAHPLLWPLFSPRTVSEAHRAVSGVPVASGWTTDITSCRAGGGGAKSPEGLLRGAGHSLLRAPQHTCMVTTPPPPPQLPSSITSPTQVTDEGIEARRGHPCDRGRIPARQHGLHHPPHMSGAQTCSQENLRGPAPSGPARSGAVPWGLASSANTSGPPWGGEGSGQNPRACVICRAAPRLLPAHLGPTHHQCWLPQVAPSGPPGVSGDRGPMVFCGNPCGPKETVSSGMGWARAVDGRRGLQGVLLARGSGPSSGSPWMGGSRWERGLGGPNRGGFTGRGHNQAGQGTRAAPSKPQLFVQRRAGAATSAPSDRCPRRAGG